MINQEIFPSEKKEMNAGIKYKMVMIKRRRRLTIVAISSALVLLAVYALLR